MKSNFERFNSKNDARKMFEKYKAVEDNAIKTLSYCEKANRIDEFDWLFKEADTALVLQPGQIVQIMANLHGEGMSPKYAVVERLRPINVYGQIRVSVVDLRLPDGTTVELYNVPERVYSACENMVGIKGDMKIADIPADLLKLVVLPDCKCGLDLAMEPLKKKCPFKDEYKEPVPPCMKEEDDD